MEQMNGTVLGMFRARRWLGACFRSFTAITIGKLYDFTVELIEPGNCRFLKKKFIHAETLFDSGNENFRIRHSQAIQFRNFFPFFLNVYSLSVRDLFKRRKINPIENFFEFDGAFLTDIKPEFIRHPT
jgi:hypothetical protein